MPLITPPGTHAGQSVLQKANLQALHLKRAVASVVQVDWLHATYPAVNAPSAEVLDALGAILRAPITMRAGPGLLGYSTRLTIVARKIDRQVVIGALCEGDAQRGRNLLQFNSRGCGLADGLWVEMHCLLAKIGARITRIDLAVDCLNGEHGVDDAVELYKEGAFHVRGRKPKSSIAGDWHAAIDGRTFYVGRRENGKLLRVYEKGRQLGDLKSLWVRWELQLGRKERDLPLDILIDPAPYYAGAFPALSQILPGASSRLPTRATKRSTDLVRRLQHLRASYGFTLDEALSLDGATPSSVVAALRRARSNATDVPALAWHEVVNKLEGR